MGHIFDLPDTEKTCPVVNRSSEDPPNAAQNPFEGIPIQDSQNHAVFGYPKGFFKSFFGMFREFQRCDETGVVEGVIVEGKLLGNAPVKLRPFSHSFCGKIEHIGGRVEAGDLKMPV